MHQYLYSEVELVFHFPSATCSHTNKFNLPRLENSVSHLLDWLSIKAEEPSLPYLTYSWVGVKRWIHIFLKDICVKMNVINYWNLDSDHQFHILNCYPFHYRTLLKDSRKYYYAYYNLILLAIHIPDH